MVPNILITGASGYLGGSVLEYLKNAAPLPAHGVIYTLVRSDQQAKQIKSLYDATPITLDLSSGVEIADQLIEKEISIVFYLIDAFRADTQLRFVAALESVGKKLGVRTHFLHTSGAKLFSNFVGHPTDRFLSDADRRLFDIQKNGQSKFPPMKTAMDANCSIIEGAEAHGVRSYIFIPCIVYGKGMGFGNQISIQTQAIVRAAKANRQVHKVDDIDGIWPVSNIYDTVTLYVELLRSMILGKDIGYGRNGYYLASPGTVAWTDIYAAMAKALARRGVVDTAEVGDVKDEVVEKNALALGCPKDFVPVQIGGACTLKADNGRKIGWTPKYEPPHILDAADEEVELILQNIR